MSSYGGEDVASSLNSSKITNLTRVNASMNCSQIDGLTKTLFTVVYSLVFLVGLVLNSYTLNFYFCRPQRKKSSSITVYLKNLTVADFLLCLCLPIRIINYTSSSTNIHLVYCSFGASVFFLNMYASILFMAYIAANRYMKIIRESLGTHVLQTVRTAHIISMVTWIVLLTVMSVYIVLSFHKQEPLTSVSVSCEHMQSEQLTVLYIIIHVCSTAIFFFILVCMVFFYHSISCRVSQMQLASSNSEKLVKSRRNMLVLTSIFCVCFIPYNLLRLPQVFLLDSCSWSKVLSYLMELAIMMSVLNICLDPLIYFFFCKAFRTRLSKRAVANNTMANTNQSSQCGTEECDETC